MALTTVCCVFVKQFQRTKKTIQTRGDPFSPEAGWTAPRPRIDPAKDDNPDQTGAGVWYSKRPKTQVKGDVTGTCSQNL